ncbi:zinc knuckle CX2CX4HX4C containing protein [Tanacetum coccineum]
MLLLLIFGHVHEYCPKKVASPLIVATSNVVTPNAEKTNDGFQTVGKKKKRKGKSKSTNGGQFTGPSVRYEPKANTSTPIKGTTYVGYTSQSTPMLKTTDNSSKKDNLFMSNSFSALNEEEEDDEEDVENVYDESANLIQNTKPSGSSSFTAAAVKTVMVKVEEEEEEDNTVCPDEGINELIEFCGSGKVVPEWTARAMGGSVPFEEALMARLGLFKPLLARAQDFLQKRPPRT